MNAQQLEQMGSGEGFIAALDQSGGSTPRALAAYGLDADAWSSDDEMFDLVHAMRTRIITSPAFTGERIIGAILFEMTMDREIDGQPTADHLWNEKRVVPFLKIDKGLADEVDGAQLMKDMPGLDELLARAVEKNIFGTKMRSVVKSANPAGVEAVVAQQFEVGATVLDAGLVPIIEPEVDINAADKGDAEELLRAQLQSHLDRVPSGRQVMFKVTLPEVDDFYAPLIADDRVLRVVALSGGYPRAEANERLARNPGMTASFSRALSEGLTAQQSDDEFTATLDATIAEIHAASIT